MTRPQGWSIAMPLRQAMAAADAYARSFTLLEDGLPVWNELERLSGDFLFGGKQVHDANIVATMLAHGERELLTFNSAHFRRFRSLIDIIEP